jgi:lysozyme
VKTSPAGIALIKSFESCRLTAYWDGTFWGDGMKRWSIGWGSTILPEDGRVEMSDTCTQAEADDWLSIDLLGAETTVLAALSSLPAQNQFDALVSLEYNAGCPKDSTIFRLMNAGTTQLAALEFPKWDKVHIDGRLQDSPGLLRRRLAEQALFLKPVAAVNG